MKTVDSFLDAIEQKNFKLVCQVYQQQAETEQVKLLISLYDLSEHARPGMYALYQQLLEKLLELAKEQKSEDKVAEDMRLLKNTIEDSKDLRLLIESPIVNPGKKKEVFKALFDGKLDIVTSQFLDLLIGKIVSIKKHFSEFK